MPRRRWGWVAAAVTLASVAGYGYLDVADKVPGILTTDPVPVSPAPFPSLPGVVAGSPSADAVAGFSADAPMPDAATIQALAEALASDPRVAQAPASASPSPEPPIDGGEAVPPAPVVPSYNGATGVVVMDALTGEVLANVRGNEPRIPASTAKLLTAIAAETTLGPDFRMTTTVTWDDAAGRLTLVAGGDMMLAADDGHGGEVHRANGYAGLGDLADQVAEALGVDASRAVTVVVDDSAFPGPTTSPLLPVYARGFGYIAPVSGLAVNVGKKTDAPYAKRWPDPSLQAAQEFADRLRERGFEVAGVTRGSAGGAPTVATVQSAPLSWVLEHTLSVSDNTIAEMIGMVLARETGRPATFDGGVAATTAALQELGIDTSTLTLRDSAGFAEENRISPLLFADALRLLTQDRAHQQLVGWLPIGALEGTLSERYVDTLAAGTVRAKTGSLSGVTALAGIIVTADGRLLTFAVLADGMRVGQEKPREAVDEFIAAVAACGCSA